MKALSAFTRVCDALWSIERPQADLGRRRGWCASAMADVGSGADRLEITDESRLDKATRAGHAHNAHLLRERPSWYSCADIDLDTAAAR
jgi:hypothetical protein